MQGAHMTSHLQPVEFSHTDFKEELSCEAKRALSMTLAAHNFFVASQQGQWLCYTCGLMEELGRMPPLWKLFLGV